MRLAPDEKYRSLPCSYTAVGCAYEDITGKKFSAEMPAGLKTSGYLTLEAENKFIRKHLPVSKKQYFPRSDRVTLREFLNSNSGCCVICVTGHYLYARGAHYMSFYHNEGDSVVCAWHIKDGSADS